MNAAKPSQARSSPPGVFEINVFQSPNVICKRWIAIHKLPEPGGHLVALSLGEVKADIGEDELLAERANGSADQGANLQGVHIPGFGHFFHDTLDDVERNVKP